ncbi:MAG: T9SS type A sorting domain-containing protein [Crocinitomicaceae bacterium]|nr:T9SS type A sorting domain-containing protein [Crocinitomicaceae bacterium]
MKTLLTLIASTFLSITVTHAQLQTSYTNAQTLIQDILAGYGLVTYDHQIIPSSVMVGNFRSWGTSLEDDHAITSGVLLTTGTIAVSDQGGPHGPNNAGGSGTSIGAPGHSLMSDLLGAETHDAAVLMFTVIPTTDTLTFEYIFASEEYPEYVGSQFTDGMGIFITGPGHDSTNIATLPFGQPVTVNNVNAGANSLYFINNGNGSTYPYDDTNYYLQYDGFTTPLKATAQVVPYESYQIIIVVVDAFDDILDSAVFLPSNSMIANQSEHTIGSLHLSPNPSSDKLTIEFAQNKSFPYKIINNAGKQIKEGRVSSNDEIDISSFPNGNYFLVIQSEKPMVKTFQKQ